MSVIDIGSMCCDCGAETFSVFGPHWEPGWDDPCTKGPDNSVTIKYSFMPEGCALGEVDHGSPAETLPWNFPYGGVTEQEFKDEIRDAIEFWEKVFEEQFDWLDLNFVDLGDEPGTVGDGGMVSMMATGLAIYDLGWRTGSATNRACWPMRGPHTSRHPMCWGCLELDIRMFISARISIGGWTGKPTTQGRVKARILRSVALVVMIFSLLWGVPFVPGVPRRSRRSSRV